MNDLVFLEPDDIDEWLIPGRKEGRRMTNRDKLNNAIGKLLDMANESLDKKEAINGETLTALQILLQFTSLNYQSL